MKRLLKLSASLIAGGLFVMLTLGVMYLADTRALPFLPDEVQEYSVIENDPSEEESSVPATDETSRGTDDVSEPSENDPLPSYLEAFESVAPSEKLVSVSTAKFDSAAQRLVRYTGAAPANLFDVAGSSQISVRMGFLFTGNRVFDSSLTDVTGLLDGLTFIGERDRYGNPLFERDGEFYYLDSSLVLQSSDFVPETDGRGFDFDVPEYVGTQKGPVARTYRAENPENKRFGYADDERVYASRCLEAFAFNDGFGCLLRDKSGVPTLEVYSDLFYPSSGNLIATDYYPPEQRDVFSLGFFYIDDGYTRVRDKNAMGRFVECLIYTDGKQLKLPADFSLVSYSDSILLMRSNLYGTYGYMTNSLSWVADPVFTEARPFLEGLAVVRTANGKYGVIDTTGAFVIEPLFDSVTDCTGGIITAYSESAGRQVFAKVYK